MRSLGIIAVVLLGATSARAQDDLAPSQPELPHVQLEGNAPPVIKLNDAVATALARNPTAAIAYAEIRRAQALVEQARSPALPTLYGSLT
jgi:outer membrane protein TolC